MENQFSAVSPGATSVPTFTVVALKLLTIYRLPEHPIYGTPGVMFDNDRGIPINTTLERSWKNNEPFLSCIPEPEGEYLCKRYHSEKYPDTFEITGVKNRTRCLFHPGNIDTDSEGCVLVGEKFDPIMKDGVPDYGIAESKDGFKQFMDSLKGVETFKLIIRKVK